VKDYTAIRRPNSLRLQNQVRLTAILILGVISGFVFMFDFRVGIGILCVSIGMVMFILIQMRAGRVLPLGGLLILAITSCFSLGYVYYPSIQSEALVSYFVPTEPVIYTTALHVIGLSTVFIFLGAFLFVHRTRTVVNLSSGSLLLRRTWNKHSGVLLVAAVVPLLLYGGGYGFGGLLQREHYLDIAGSQIFVSAASLSSPIGVGLVSMVLFSSKTKLLHRLIAMALAVAYLFVLFSSGSRSIALIPLAGLWVYIELRSPPLMRKFLAFCCAAYAFVVMFNLPLLFRYNVKGAGFFPYYDFVINNFSSIFDIQFSQLLGNILFGVPLTGDIALHGHLPSSNFWTAINPMPGSLSGWGGILSQYSWAPATPYNTFGELQAYGTLYLALFMVSIGALVSWIDNMISQFDPDIRRIVVVVALVSVLLVCASMFQYPVRNSTRTLWYLIFGIVSLKLFISHRTWFGRSLVQ
jgi:hypothetical protein